MSRFSPYSTVRPNFIVFRGTTDSKGRIYEDFKQKPATYDSSYEIALDKMNMDSKAVNNLVEEEDSLDFRVRYADGTSEEFTVGKCRIVTLQDLILQMQKSIVANGLQLRVEMDNLQKKLSLYVKGLALSLPLKVARILNLVTREDKISPLWQDMHQGIAKLSIALQHLQISGINSTSGQPFAVPLHQEKNIWNEISSSSFQSVLLHSDIAMPSFVGSQYVNILADLTYDETEDVAHYDMLNFQWRRLSSTIIRKPHVQLSDTRGRPLTGIHCNIVCRLRKRSPF